LLEMRQQSRTQIGVPWHVQGKLCPGKRGGLAGRFAGFVLATDGSPMADLADVAESICQGPAKAPATRTATRVAG
jgi:hypothetical protein